MKEGPYIITMQTDRGTPGVYWVDENKLTDPQFESIPMFQVDPEAAIAVDKHYLICYDATGEEFTDIGGLLAAPAIAVELDYDYPNERIPTNRGNKQHAIVHVKAWGDVEGLQEAFPDAKTVSLGHMLSQIPASDKLGGWRGGGRPLLRPPEAYQSVIGVYITPDEKAMLDEAFKGMTVRQRTEWILEQVERLLAEKEDS